MSMRTGDKANKRMKERERAVRVCVYSRERQEGAEVNVKRTCG